jgi:hypothetical protein
MAYYQITIPSTVLDLILLFKLLASITNIAEEVFSAEYEEAKKIVDTF